SIPTTLQIRRKIPTGLSPILADPTQIHQVLMNLLTNAGHAMREDGGTLTVELEEVDSCPGHGPGGESEASNRWLRLTVADTGHGMAPEILERIFDPYFTTKKQGEGTGLGLAQVHGIVTGNGGIITVESKPGQGAVFRVFFPIIADGIREEADWDHEVPTGKESILLVDDEPPIVHLGQRMLEGLGYSVLAVTGAIEAMELFRVSPDTFDLIITDMTMPGLTGKEIAAQVLKMRPGRPVIIVTGYSELITHEDALAMGVGALLKKPLQRLSLAQTVRRVLDSEKKHATIIS
ncbi:MAG: ATP-binding protein, partial [Pseudomonadota bacterium]